MILEKLHGFAKRQLCPPTASSNWKFSTTGCFSILITQRKIHRMPVRPNLKETTTALVTMHSENMNVKKDCFSQESNIQGDISPKENVVQEVPMDDVKRLLDASIQHEEKLNELYQLYSTQYPADGEFWQQLAREETNHAEWLQKLKVLHARGGADLETKVKVQAVILSLDIQPRFKCTGFHSGQGSQVFYGS